MGGSLLHEGFSSCAGLATGGSDAARLARPAPYLAWGSKDVTDAHLSLFAVMSFIFTTNTCSHTYNTSLHLLYTTDTAVHTSSLVLLFKVVFEAQ